MITEENKKTLAINKASHVCMHFLKTLTIFSKTTTTTTKIHGHQLICVSNFSLVIVQRKANASANVKCEIRTATRTAPTQNFQA